MSWLSDALGVPDTVDAISNRLKEIISTTLMGEGTLLSAVIEEAGDEARSILDGATITITVKLKEGK